MEERLGFIHDEMTLKVLILFILSRLPEPVERQELTDTVLLCDNAISYFDFSECLEHLVSTGHAELSRGLYAVTDKGRDNCEAAESILPYSVRVRAEKATYALASIQRRSAMIRASHEMRARGGFTVKLSMSDGVGDVLSLELLVGDEKQSAAIEENFRRNAESIYGSFINILLEEK